MIIKDYKFPEFLENIPIEKKVFLLHGTSNSKIWYFRKLLEFKLVGPKALEQMKLIFLDKSLVNKDKNILINEIKTRSFFGDKKVIVVNDITDKDSNFIKDILENFDPDDHYLILTGGYLSQNSKIRKLIETNFKSCSTGFYPSELTEREIQNQLKIFKIKISDNIAIKKLRDLSSIYDFLEFKQELKKLHLFKSFDEQPLSQEEIENVFSLELSSNEKKLFDFLLEKKIQFVVDYFSNYTGEIKNPNSFLFNATNQFNVMYRMVTTEDKSFSFLKKLWPPILGKNKEKFIRNIKNWKQSNIEEALLILRQTELRIRKNSKLSPKKIISFAFINICLLNN
ncbi:MAG: DNA polymerase III subunit delta [Paracoccaceae bacterium]